MLSEIICDDPFSEYLNGICIEAAPPPPRSVVEGSLCIQRPFAYREYLCIQILGVALRLSDFLFSATGNLFCLCLK